MPDRTVIYRNPHGQEFYRETLRVGWLQWLLSKIRRGRG